MPPESGGICGRLTAYSPLGCIQGGEGNRELEDAFRDAGGTTDSSPPCSRWLSEEVKDCEIEELEPRRTGETGIWWGALVAQHVADARELPTAKQTFFQFILYASNSAGERRHGVLFSQACTQNKCALQRLSPVGSENEAGKG